MKGRKGQKSVPLSAAWLQPSVGLKCSCSAVLTEGYSPYTLLTRLASASQTHTLRVKPLLITMARLALQPLTPFLNCPALAGAHICEHFSWAVSPSQRAAEQKQLVKRSVAVVQMRYKTCASVCPQKVLKRSSPLRPRLYKRFV